MLYLIGLGLGGPLDITLRGLRCLKQCKRIYLEVYTSKMPNYNRFELETVFGVENIIEADRQTVEEESDVILRGADVEDVGFLVIGDVLSATTHCDIILQANRLGIKWEIIHNTSIINAVSSCGLQLYRFGETVSIPLWNDNWMPNSFIEKIVSNRNRDLHTLCLLDIKVNEIDWEKVAKQLDIVRQQKTTYFMNCKQAATQILNAFRDSADWTCVAALRVGVENEQSFIVGSIAQFSNADKLIFGDPLHSLVICGSTLHPMEEDMINLWEKIN